jgi:hypothetical protein
MPLLTSWVKKPPKKEEKRMRTKEKDIRSEDCPALRPFCEKHRSAS